MSIGIPQGVSEGVNIFTRMLNSGVVQGTLSRCGLPVPGIGANIKNKYGDEKEQYKDQCKGPVYWARERLFTFGIFGGIVAKILSFLIGRSQKADPENEGAGAKLFSKLAPIKFLLDIGALIGIGGSIYSQYHKLHVKAGVSDKAYIREVSRNVGVPLETVAHDFLKGKADAARLLRYNRSKERNEQKEVEDILTNVRNGKRIKKFFIGGAGTGKTHTMRKICNEIIEYEANQTSSPKREVVVRTLSIPDLGKRIAGTNSWLGNVQEAASALQVQGADAALGLFKNNPQTTLLHCLSGISDEIEAAHKQGKRYVLQLDEIDKIWTLAKNPETNKLEAGGIVSEIALQLQQILEYENLDIILTSNAEASRMMGLDELVAEGKNEQSLPSQLVGLIDRINKIRTNMTTPDYDTQSRITAAYLMELKRTTNKTYEQLFANEILDQIPNYGSLPEQDFEDKLATLLYKDIYQSTDPSNVRDIAIANIELNRSTHLSNNPDRYIEAAAFKTLNGRLIHEAIMEKYKDNIENCSALGGRLDQVTLTGINSYLRTVLQPAFDDINKRLEKQIGEAKVQQEQQRITEEEKTKKEDAVKADLNIRKAYQEVKDLETRFLKLTDVEVEKLISADQEKSEDERITSRIDSFLSDECLLKTQPNRLKNRARFLLAELNIALAA